MLNLVFGLVMFGLVAATTSSCAMFTRDPNTGQVVFDADGAALDAMAFAEIARTVALEFETSDPELQAKITEMADSLDALAMEWRAVAQTGESATLTAKIDAALALVDAVLVQVDPDTAERWGPYIRAIRLSIRLAAIYADAPQPAPPLPEP